jgi:hypothetical protein
MLQDCNQLIPLDVAWGGLCLDLFNDFVSLCHLLAKAAWNCNYDPVTDHCHESYGCVSCGSFKE